MDEGKKVLRRLSQALKEYRAERKLNTRQAALRAGVDLIVYLFAEQGKDVSVQDYESLCLWMGVPFDSFDGVGEQGCREPSRLTAAQAKMLAVLRKVPGPSAARFAEMVWPNSPMHVKYSNGGHGCAQGKAAWLKGGSEMAKLRKKGLARIDYFGSGNPTKITELGMKLLSEYEQAHGKVEV